jgi:hypothetical protein
MPDIFGRVDQIYGGGLTADSLFMTFPQLPGAGVGLIVQQVGLQYRQAVRRVFEIGPGALPPFAGILGLTGPADCDALDPSDPLFAQKTTACDNRSQFTYYIASRPEGTFNLARIFGPTAIGAAFYATYGNPCNPNPNLTLSANVGCNGIAVSPKQFWDMGGFLVTDMMMNVTAQEMVIQEGVGGMFIGLNINTQ